MYSRFTYWRWWSSIANCKFTRGYPWYLHDKVYITSIISSCHPRDWRSAANKQAGLGVDSWRRSESRVVSSDMIFYLESNIFKILWYHLYIYIPLEKKRLIYSYTIYLSLHISMHISIIHNTKRFHELLSLCHAQRPPASRGWSLDSHREGMCCIRI